MAVERSTMLMTDAGTDAGTRSDVVSRTDSHHDQHCRLHPPSNTKMPPKLSTTSNLGGSAYQKSIKQRASRTQIRLGPVRQGPTILNVYIHADNGADDDRAIIDPIRAYLDVFPIVSSTKRGKTDNGSNASALQWRRNFGNFAHILAFTGKVNELLIRVLWGIREQKDIRVSRTW